MKYIIAIIITSTFLTICTIVYGQSSSTIWYVDYETPNSIGTLKRSNCLDTIPKKPERLLKEINKKFPNVGFKLLKIKKDTIFLKVINSNALTESLGTTGCDEVLAITTYTLTEIKNISKIYFDMVDGSHAGKGVRTRNSFKEIFEIK